MTVTREVTATAYHTAGVLGRQGVGQGAWGDTLREGVKAIAVSRDLIPLGLDSGTPVMIEGLEDTFVVMDKMGRRWKDRIDIYMGIDRKRARNWGRKELTIAWKVDTTEVALPEEMFPVEAEL